MRKFLSSGYALFLFIMALPLLMSCSEDDYLNSIPSNSSALVSVDFRTLVSSLSESRDLEKDKNISSLLQNVLGVSDVKDCGIDFSSKAYMFETVEGNFGLVARVSDDDALSEIFTKLQSSGICSRLETHSDCLFTVIKDYWAVGFSSRALIVIGPVLPVQHVEACRRISEYLKQDKSKGITSSPLFERISNMNGVINIVSRLSALPDNASALLSLGIPINVDASQVMIAAEISSANSSCLEINSETFSLDEQIDKELKRNNKMLRENSGKYAEVLSSDAYAGLFMNFKGDKFIKLLHENSVLRTFLAGANMAIDIDKIIKSIDGDAVVILPDNSETNKSLIFTAQLDDKHFLDDVAYWKRSCPAGGKIADWRKDAYCYINGNFNYYFGVSSDMQYYSGTSKSEALSSLSKAENPLPQRVKEVIKDSRLCLVVNTDKLFAKDTSGLSFKLFQTVFGDVKYILYTVE